jgi:dephospho-CoA kinase
MLRVGLTGGIGSGKSTVARIFKVLGIPVFNADETAKKILEEDATLITAIKKEFGETSYINGRLNRKYLADIVFNDSYRLAILNSLTHPATIATSERWMDQQTSPYAIKEAALMFESAASAGVDCIIGVYAPQNMRIKRVMERDGTGRQEVLARMDRQMNEDIKMKLCDFIIRNDEQQLLIPQVLHLHEILMNHQ